MSRYKRRPTCSRGRTPLCTGEPQPLKEKLLRLMCRSLRVRHIQLIAISGAIGAGVFISIGGPLTAGGPLALLIGVSLWCFVIWVRPSSCGRC